MESNRSIRMKVEGSSSQTDNFDICGSEQNPLEDNATQNVNRNDFDDLRNAIQHKMLDYNQIILGLINNLLHQQGYDTAENSEEFNIYSSNEVRNWATQNIKVATGVSSDEEDIIDEIYCDLVDGGKLSFNGQGVDNVTKQEALSNLYLLGIKNAKSFLNISIPMDNMSKIENRAGEVVKTLRIMDDEYARDRQYENIKRLFGIEDPQLSSQMTFSDTIHVHNKQQLLDQISNFLRNASDTKTEWACVQATIILNGHGLHDGTIALSQDKPISFDIVVEHIGNVIAKLHNEGRIFPLGVLVLNGVCHSYKSKGLQPQNIAVDVRYFTDTNNPITTVNYTLGGTWANGKFVVDSRHVELEDEATNQFAEDVTTDDLKTVLVEKLTATSEAKSTDERESESISASRDKDS